MKDEGVLAQVTRSSFHPSSFRLHPFELARLRTYPQHTLPLLPLVRSRPGGVCKASVVRSPKSDNFSNHFRFLIANCRLVAPFSCAAVGSKKGQDDLGLINRRSQIG